MKKYVSTIHFLKKNSEIQKVNDAPGTDAKDVHVLLPLAL